MTLRRSEILANREKAISFLEGAGRRRVAGTLDKGDGRRCCLGHMSYALEILRHRRYDGGWSYGEDNEVDVAPQELIDLLGLWNEDGTGIRVISKDGDDYNRVINCLTELNDNAEWGANRIAKMLRPMINGGEGTPFRPLSDYPE